MIATAPTRVKLCGITQPDHARIAAAAGADAIGLVFHRASSRCVDAETARAIVAALPPFVAPVGLFLDAEAEWVDEIVRRVPLALLQFHGAERGEYCRAFARPYIKSVAMAGVVDWDELTRSYADAQGLLVDSHRPGTSGGTGETFDWTHLPHTRSFRLILAGGLTPANVANAIEQTQPDAVDVSSGVESATGIKDETLITRFTEEVRRGDRNRS